MKKCNLFNDSNKGSSFANFNKTTRIQKAIKIEKLMKMFSTLPNGTVLDVGAGSGYIIKHFSDLGFGESRTFAVDIIDERQIVDGYNFQIIEGTNLPFSDNMFDSIISNHVIEHVGNDMQINHLKEIYRTLKPNGVFYFAVPNKWRFIEPHYKLPFLSWLPVSLASIYLCITRKGAYYDCRPLSRTITSTLLKKEGFLFTEVTLDAIRLIGDIEHCNIIKKFITILPKGFLKIFFPFMPTIIYICRKQMY